MPSDIEASVQRVLDIQAVANVQGRYMYYLEGHRYDDILSLFALDHPEVLVEIGEGGGYSGGEKVRTMFLNVMRPFFMRPGMLPLHMLTTPVIEVDLQSGRARGMWQTFGCASFPSEDGLKAVWQQGAYDNSYVKQDGAWKILRMRWFPNFRSSFDQGWVKEPLFRMPALDLSRFPEELRPNAPSSGAFDTYDPSGVRTNAPVPPEPGQPIP